MSATEREHHRLETFRRLSEKKNPWLIQIRLYADKGCTIQQFKRKLKGTGVEVDTSYQPKRVSPAIFVGRGFASARAVRVAQSDMWLQWRAPRRPERRDITFFEEIRFDDERSNRPVG